MKLISKQKKSVVLNMTSLIDVLFILIIFFAVSSTFLEQPGIQLTLPKAESQENFTTQKIIIYIDPDETIYFNEQQVKTNELVAKIKTIDPSLTTENIVLKADSKVDHGKVIEVMDLLRKNKIYKIVVSTSKPE